MQNSISFNETFSLFISDEVFVILGLNQSTTFYAILKLCFRSIL